MGRSKPEFSQLSGGVRLGRGFYRRHGWECDAGSGRQEPRGVVDSLEDLRQPALATHSVHPSVRRFFEDTAGLELFVESHWRGPFFVLWLLVRPLMAWFGQFVLPVRRARILTRCFCLDVAADGRSDVRGIERYYAETQQAFQVAAYATWEHAGIHYMHASFPMPFGQIAGLLRLDPLLADSNGRLGVALTSKRRRGHPEDRARVWALIGRVAIPSPFGERLSLWAPGAPDCSVPASPRCPDATILGCHEQSLFGLRFVRHYYWFRPLAGSPEPSSAPRSVRG
ncbi:MAG: hypothetical protein H6718_34910 [Polyangiaceae bacterium]|nr:hypothetical protein [Myxococcales bacterium]MCB9590650.1 hypothetical protein [Polyangiaceae bacterium]